MTSRGTVRRRQYLGAPRVGFFGLLGGGNVGNDGSLEVVLTYLRTDHPDAVVDAMCTGPERVRVQYGVEATPLLWCQRFEKNTGGATSIALKVVGKGVDNAVRIAAWVRRHDTVIVPGAGVLEATLRTRAWGLPFSLFVLCASGKLFGTKVALVNVGANVINQRLTRWLLKSAARLAFYRSYRDVLSREAMRRGGLDTTHDGVYPDLAFGMPAPPVHQSGGHAVAVGVMAYYGANDDRRSANDIHEAYLEKVKCFVRWLVDSGRQVRLVGGDSRFDDSVVQEILTDLHAHRPNLDPGMVIAEPVLSLGELMRQLSLVDTVVATRYHNVLSALRLSKPTISISYSGKHDVLMADMGLADFCQPLRSLDVHRLVEQFTELEGLSNELSQRLLERNKAKAQALDHQFAVLSSVLFEAGNQERAA